MVQVDPVGLPDEICRLFLLFNLAGEPISLRRTPLTDGRTSEDPTRVPIPSPVDGNESPALPPSAPLPSWRPLPTDGRRLLISTSPSFF